MKKIVRKIYFDYEKEEKFLNQMSENGWGLTNYSWGKYEFEETQKGEYIYRLELLEFPIDDPNSEEYIEFMKDLGAEVVATYNQWVYFRRKATEGEFNLYSDIDSRIKHYSRVQTLFLIVMGVNFFMGIYNLYIGQTLTKPSYFDINSYIAILSLSIGTLILIFISIPLWKKIKYLENEKNIRE